MGILSCCILIYINILYRLPFDHRWHWHVFCTDGRGAERPCTKAVSMRIIIRTHHYSSLWLQSAKIREGRDSLVLREAQDKTLGKLVQTVINSKL